MKCGVVCLASQLKTPLSHYLTIISLLLLQYPWIGSVVIPFRSELDCCLFLLIVWNTESRRLEVHLQSCQNMGCCASTDTTAPQEELAVSPTDYSNVLSNVDLATTATSRTFKPPKVKLLSKSPSGSMFISQSMDDSSARTASPMAEGEHRNGGARDSSSPSFNPLHSATSQRNDNSLNVDSIIPYEEAKRRWPLLDGESSAYPRPSFGAEEGVETDDDEALLSNADDAPVQRCCWNDDSENNSLRSYRRRSRCMMPVTHGATLLDGGGATATTSCTLMSVDQAISGSSQQQQAVTFLANAVLLLSVEATQCGQPQLTLSSRCASLQPSPVHHGIAGGNGQQSPPTNGGFSARCSPLPRSISLSSIPILGADISHSSQLAQPRVVAKRIASPRVVLLLESREDEPSPYFE